MPTNTPAIQAKAEAMTHKTYLAKVLFFCILHGRDSLIGYMYSKVVIYCQCTKNIEIILVIGTESDIAEKIDCMFYEVQLRSKGSVTNNSKFTSIIQ